MSGAARALAAMFAVALAPWLAQAPSARALGFAPCAGGGGFACTTLTVPLERGGGASGSVALKIERLQQAATPSETAVVALAGGPGQAATPLASELQSAIAPALAGRDLIVFDQRGTGASGPLACGALEGEAGIATIGQAFERCAKQIGPERGGYTTAESVADIEAIRQALGYRRLVLFGVSYGTKVALEYAEAHPAQVEALVLDSVVPPERDDPFQLASFEAMKPAFAELCARSACAGIGAKPLADLARLSARMGRHALSGYVYDGSGHRHHTTMSDVALLNLVSAGDLNPALRALLPASVVSALRGDPAPLLRLNLLSEGLVPNLPGGPPALAARATASGFAAAGGRSVAATASSDGVDEALFVDTTCEEEPFPWRRAAQPATRLSEALAALRAVPSSAFYPFDASVEWADSVLPGCAQWPNASQEPAPVGTLPDVPTLILSGAQDLRTPTAGAEALAHRIPDAQLLVVPYTGHSVLGSDFSGCAQAAVQSFFATGPVAACSTSAPDPFAPTPVTPTRIADVQPVGGVQGLPGRTLTVVLETILDLERQVVGATLQASQQLPSGASFGGLRGGYARLSSTSLRLHKLSFVAGVQLTGAFAISGGRLRPSEVRVEGSLAARGSVRIGSPTVAGTLGSRHFSVELSKVHLASARTEAARGRPSSVSSEAWTGSHAPGSLLPLAFPHPALVEPR